MSPATAPGVCGTPLQLRPLRPDDVPALVAAVRGSLDTLSPWLPWCHAGYGEADARAWVTQAAAAWDAGSGYAFGIFVAGDGALLGGAGLSRIDRAAGSANLGYWVAAAHRGRGVATRAAGHVATYAFDVQRLSRVEIVTAPGNVASQRVAAKLGATRLPGWPVDDRVLVDGRPSPAVHYVLAPGADPSTA